MNKTFVTLSFLLFVVIHFPALAQKQAKKDITKQNKVMVKIVNPGSRAAFLLEGFFNESITDEILKQISRQTFEDVKLYGNEDNYPDCVKEKLNYSPANPEEEIADNFLKSLKLYRIATFNNTRNGENFGELSILVASAIDNKNIETDCNYEKDFYVVIPSKDIELID